MSAEAEHEVVTPIGGAVRDASASSLLEDLQAEHRALADRRTKVFDVPGYSRLAVRYKAVDLKVIDKIQDRARKDGGDLAFIHAAAEIIGNCCEEVLIRDDEGKPSPLNKQLERWGDEPIRYDVRLVEALGAEGDKMKMIVESVFKVFEPETGNDVVMMDHADEIVRWIKSGSRGADEDF